MVLICAAALATLAGTKKVRIDQLLCSKAALALPMLDPHFLTIGGNRIHAVAAKPALFGYQSGP